MYFDPMSTKSIVLRFSLFGILAGLLNVLGWLGGMEWVFWLGLVLFCGIYFSRNIRPPFYWPAMLLGIIWGLSTAFVQSLFYDLFLHNNPNYAASFNELSKFIDPRLYLLISNPLRGIITGMLVFLAALLFKKSKT